MSLSDTRRFPVQAHVMLSREDADAARRMAKRSGMTLSTWLRGAIMSRIQAESGAAGATATPGAVAGAVA